MLLRIREYRHEFNMSIDLDGRLVIILLGLLRVILYFIFSLKTLYNKINFADFTKKILDFQNFQKTKFFRQIFENSIIHKPSLGSREFPQKNWAQTCEQTDTQSIYRLYVIQKLVENLSFIIIQYSHAHASDALFY